MTTTFTGLPDLYNAADDLIGRNLEAGRADKPAFIDETRSYSYADIDRLSSQVANLLTSRGIRMEDRALLYLLDTVEFPAVFLGAIKAGVVPIPVNVRLTAADYHFMLEDSRARALFVSESLLGQFLPHIAQHPFLQMVIVVGDDGHGYERLSEALLGQPDRFDVAPTRRDDMCFWLYTSGTTGRPKGAVHLQSHMVQTAELYAVPTLQIDENDVMFSAAKLFFAYRLGNTLLFPMAVGATAILHAGPPDADAVCQILRDKKPTIFCGVPTLFAMLLASNRLPGPGEHRVRIATSAGEPLPVDLYRRFKEKTRVDILEGFGTTEMLHIFLTNQLNDIQPGSIGRPARGYELRLVDDGGNVVHESDEVGTLEISGPTSAIMYWNQRNRSLETFQGPWTRTSDKCWRDDGGHYLYVGRSDDMMKVGGIYVSPYEVEAAILKHDKVLEVAVVGHPDQDNLIKPKAFVVLRDGVAPAEALAEDIKAFVKSELAVFKYPRWVEFIDELPKTATGKVQRYKLRARGASGRVEEVS